MVEISYGCGHASAGGLLRLSAGESAIDFRPSATPSAETFVRERIGVLELEKGRVKLSAEAAEIAGGELMRLNRIWLRRR